MERRKFLERAGIVTVASTAGAAGCLDVSLGGNESGGDGGDGGSGDGSGGDGSSGDGSSDGSSGDGSSDGGGGDGSGGDGSGGGMTGTPTPTPAPTMASNLSIGEGARAPYDAWASSSVYGSADFQASSVDLAALQSATGSNGATPTPTPQGTQTTTDPVVAYPMSFLFIAAFSGFALASFNLGNVTSQGSSAERIDLVNSVLVFEGSYDVGTLQGMVGESQATEAGSYEGYTLYSQGTGDSEAVLGLSGDALVHASTGEQVSDPRSAVEAAIDAGTGNATSYGSEHPPYEALVTALPVQPIMGTMFSPDGAVRQGTPTPTPTPQPGGGSQDLFNVSEFDLQGSLHGIASGIDFDQAAETATASMALRYTSAGEVDDRSLIRSQAAPQASDVAVQISGPMVRIVASYADRPAI